MRTVFKFHLHQFGWTEIEVGQNPDGTTGVVLVGTDPATQNPAIWIDCDPNGPKVQQRAFTIVPTGGTVPSDEDIEPVEHVGSFIDGCLVWHVYERTFYHGD